MEAIFNITPTRGRIHVSSGSDMERYLTEKEGVMQIVKLKDYAKSTEKERLYSFIFGPIMSCAVDGFTAQGYEGVDKVKARYMLEAEFCKEESYNPKTGKVTIYTESISGMGVKRLHKFAVDSLFFLETDLGQKVPDAEAFKMRVSSGRDYESIKKEK
jgi:predicted transcriptional regulator